MTRFIAKEKLPQLWGFLASCGPLYLPVNEGTSVTFRAWEQGDEVDLEAVNSTSSPKGIFLPPWETYLQFSRTGKELTLAPAGPDIPEEPATAFGLRPCDVQAIQLLDLAFEKTEPADQLYCRRRERATIVALACSQPDPFCFCRAFGIDPAEAPGADVLSWQQGEQLYMEARSSKGERWLESAGELLQEGNGEQKPAPVETADFSLNLDGLPEKLSTRFEDPVWDQIYRSCLGCGACTYICPTCYCFDVQDYGHREQGERFRCWDSCQFSQYTLTAGGNNPRPTRKERVRNRFLHKLQYFPENYQKFACVGCGRCLRSCPVNLDIVKVIRDLGGETVAR
ncbi:MAG TPA: 4Fe-4S ferredoxin [Firmicutes bacterium]|nr:4Fe-4S ferredoxin [Bacillota bacterium]